MFEVWEKAAAKKIVSDNGIRYNGSFFLGWSSHLNRLRENKQVTFLFSVGKTEGI